MYSTSTLVLAQRRQVGLGDAALERTGGAELVAAGVVGELPLIEPSVLSISTLSTSPARTEVMKSA